MTSLVTGGLIIIVGDALLVIGTIVVLFLLNAELALVACAIFPVLAVATVIAEKLAGGPFRASRHQLGALSAEARELGDGIETMRLFAAEERHRMRFERLNEAFRRSSVRGQTVMAFYLPLGQAVGLLGFAAVIVYGGREAIEGAITVGVIVSFLAYLRSLLEVLPELANVAGIVVQGIAGAGAVADVLAEPLDDAERPGARPLDRVEGELRFEHVEFAYPGGAPVIHGVDLTIGAGETVAIVGETGAGKSTLLRLLTRLYVPTGGRVLIDGQDTRDIAGPSLRDQLAIVPQEPFLFSTTVRENIALARPDAGAEEVRAALDSLDVADLIDRLPQGIDTPIRQRGASLSSGQLQIVSLARAVLAEPRVVALDEATSNLDLATERRIQVALERLLEGRTAVIVAHRLETVRRADRIVVLEQGRIAEQGTHDDLLARGGLYAELHAAWQQGIARGI